MGDWNFLGGILEEVHIHSTMVGKIWLTILFIFRMLVLGVAAEDVWNDEQADFICNTEQPGCRNVCYDLAFPISLIRYWVLQVIFVSSPSLVYMGHALYRLRALEKARQRKKALLRRELEMVDVEMAEAKKRIEREMKQLDQGKLNKAPLRGSLLRTYVAHIFTRSAVEVLFMTGQYLLYGFHLYPLFKCEREPCPNAVDCYVSRPTEKSVFMVFMQCIAAVSLFLNILEIMHLGYKKIKKGILDFYPHLRDERDEFDDFYASNSKKQSVVQIARKATIASAPSDYNFLMGKAQGTGMYPNFMNPPAVFPLQSELQEEPEDSLHLSPHSEDDGKETGGPDSPKWAHGSFNCSTVLEGKSSDTDSYGGTKNNSEYTSARMRSKSEAKHPSRPSTPESLDDSSSGSRHSPRPPSSNRKTSLGSSTSSKRAPDLHI
uniref:Gap junction protein n=1 Tax=Myripristis murdjan TaxID=586833 RepID=A0A667ZZT1_9TELE